MVQGLCQVSSNAGLTEGSAGRQHIWNDNSFGLAESDRHLSTDHADRYSIVMGTEGKKI